MNTADGVLVSVDGPVLIVTLDRPPANAIDAATSRSLRNAIARLDSEDTLRVAVLTATGDRTFSAGWDLNESRKSSGVDTDHGPGGFAGITDEFHRPKPIIAAVNGSAYGGGVELMLAADLVVAADTSTFSFPETRLGLLPDAGGIVRLAARLPRAVATEMLLTGRAMTAAEASRWGLINRIAPQSRVLEVAMTLAREICGSAPLAVAAVLDTIARTSAMTDRDGLFAMRSLRSVKAVADSWDAGEGTRAFTEKRVPQWRGC